MVVSLNEKDFEREVLREKGVVMVDFFAEWCGPCQTMAPVIEALAEEEKERIKVVKVNVDEEPRLAQRYGVMSIPTLVFFKEGKEVSRLVGRQSKKKIKEEIKKYVKQRR